MIVKNYTKELNKIKKCAIYAKKIGLEKIAYAITESVIDSILPTTENIKFAFDISLAHISNGNYNKASQWINLIENIKDINYDSNKLSYAINIFMRLTQRNDIKFI